MDNVKKKVKVTLKLEQLVEVDALDANCADLLCDLAIDALLDERAIGEGVTDAVTFASRRVGARIMLGSFDDVELEML